MGKNRLVWAFLLILALVLVACGGGQQPASEVEEPEETTEEVAETEEVEEVEEVAEEEEEMEEEEMMDSPIAAGGAGYIDRALAGEFEGTVVTMFGPVTDEDEAKLNATMAEFEAATGIDFQYEGSKEFEATIGIRVDAGDPPDIADFPQPGLAATFARQGVVVDLNEHFPDGYLQGQYIDSWLDMATIEGADGEIMAGVWHRVFGKSQVWYPVDDWEAAGYPIPETWDEMIEVMDLIVEDGDTPWCIGIESGVATGWTATDWMEEIMLRTTSLDNYDAWVRGDLDFSSPEVVNAAEVMSEIWFNDDYVFGGRSAIATTSFGDSPAAMFEDPPKCWMHKQGSFITSFFPEGAEAGVDYDFFYLPPLDEAQGRPYLVSGDLYVAFDDRPEVLAVMEYFSRGQSLQVWMEQGGALSPHKDVDLSWHGDIVEAGIGEAISLATSVRFDASDLMPGEVGAGSFWTGMTDYVSGAKDLETVMAEIDESWPEGIQGEAGDEIEGGDAPSIAEIAVADGGFTTLVAALDAAGLVETLSGPGEFTVFAPTDDAFAALPEGTVEALLEDPGGDLTDILLYHVVDGVAMADAVVTLDSVTTLNGADVSIEVVDGGVVLNGSVNVVVTDIEASNGVIHVIDAVLLPPAEMSSIECQVDLTGETIVIYQQAGREGPLAAILGQGFAYATEDIVEYINGDGGICGAEIEVVFGETNYDPAREVEVYEGFRVSEPKPSVLLTYGSGATIALKDRVVEDEIVNFAAGLNAEAMYNPAGGYTIGTAPIYSDQFAGFIEYLVDNWDDVKPEGAGDDIVVGVIGWPNSFGAGATTPEAIAYAEGLGVTVLPLEEAELSPDADMVGPIQNLLLSGANVIYNQSLSFTPAQVVGTARAIGIWDSVVVGGVNWSMHDDVPRFLGENPELMDGYCGVFPYVYYGEEAPGVQLAEEIFAASGRDIVDRSTTYLTVVGTFLALRDVYTVAANNVGSADISGADVLDAMISMEEIDSMGITTFNVDAETRAPRQAQIRCIRWDGEQLNWEIEKDFFTLPDTRPSGE